MSERFLHSNITWVFAIDNNEFERDLLEQSATSISRSHHQKPGEKVPEVVFN